MIKRLLLITLILAILVTPIIALASDISGAKYWASILISNNSTATTNVATTANISTTNLIDGNYLNASANNCVIRTSSGADVPFMPGYTSDNNPWCIWVPSIGANSYLTDILYTANSTGGVIRYFPGIGGMTTPDNDATLELGGNFTIEQKGWVDTTIGLVSRAVGVDVDRDEDVYLYKDYGADYFNALDIDFELYIDSSSLDNSEAGPAITNTIGSLSDLAATDLVVVAQRAGGAYSLQLVRGNAVASDVYVSSANTSYYCTLTRAAGNDVAQVKIYTDAARTVLVDTLAVAGFGAIKWRYSYGFINNNSGVGGSSWTGYVNNMSLTGDSNLEDFYSYIEVDANKKLELSNDTLVSKLFAFWTYINGSGNITSTVGTSAKVTASGVSSGNHTIKVTQYAPSNWFDTDWTYRKKLTMDNSASSENLTDWPVVFSINSTSFDFSEAQTNGEDIRFTDSDGTSRLDYLLDSWNGTTEKAIIVYQAPQIDAGSNTDSVYMYWGNAGASDNQSPTAVFDANTVFWGTYNGSDNSSINDATSYNNDGTFKGLNEPLWSEVAVSGLWNLDFDGNDDYVDCGADPSLLTGTTGTLILWIYSENLANNRDEKVIAFGDTNAAEFAFFALLNGAVRGYVKIATVAQWTVDTDATIDDYQKWVQLALVQDGTSPVIYVSGSAPAQTFSVFADKTKWLTACAGLDNSRIGCLNQAGGGNSGFFLGQTALPRVYNDELTAEEIENLYNQEKHLFGIAGDFVTFGSKESHPTLYIYVDNVLKAESLSANVTNNSANWTFLQNNVMPYMEYQKIWIGGNLRQHIVWQYDNVFTDLSGNSNNATPSFRTASSNANVSAEMISFQPIAEARAPAYVLGEAPPFINPAIVGNVTGNFTTTPGTGAFPLATVIAAIATATDTPAQLPLLIIALFVILAASLSISAIMRKHGSGSILVKVLVIVAFMGIFVALGNFAIDFWMIIVFLIIGVCLGFASKQLGWT